MDNSLGVICIFSLRYALGRRTYAPGLVVSYVKQRWFDLDEKDRRLMCTQFVRDIHQAIDMGCAGDKCDIDTWTSFAEWLTERA